MTTSILIPCFNASAFLKQTLESVIENMAPEDEVIVVDDHSEDDSIIQARSILQEAGVHHAVTRNPDKGACAARNHAFELSRGDLIQWLDADDLLAVDKIARQKEHLKTHPSTLVVSPFRPFVGDPKTGIISDDREWPSSSDLSPSDWLASGQMTIPACWLGHRSVFEAAGPWDNSLKINQDGEYFTRVLASAEVVHFESEAEVYYRREVKGSVSRFSPEKVDSLFRSTESMERTALSLEDSHRMRQMVANRWQQFIYTAYPSRPDLIQAAQSKLQSLPAPNISNPNAVSTLSKLVSRTLGWKALTQARLLRSKITAS